jgi:hypothetical protein
MRTIPRTPSPSPLHPTHPIPNLPVACFMDTLKKAPLPKGYVIAESVRGLCPSTATILRPR